mmetsp:Transcript_23354/g.57725  ORF Transcript_23354/g.57725 Transcript_23354/m.57725 type:complete len:257 (-) Transcript_23354:1439-2209(-)
MLCLGPAGACCAGDDGFRPRVQPGQAVCCGHHLRVLGAPPAALLLRNRRDIHPRRPDTQRRDGEVPRGGYAHQFCVHEIRRQGDPPCNGFPPGQDHRHHRRGRAREENPRATRHRQKKEHHDNRSCDCGWDQAGLFPHRQHGRDAREHHELEAVPPGQRGVCDQERRHAQRDEQHSPHQGGRLLRGGRHRGRQIPWDHDDGSSAAIRAGPWRQGHAAAGRGRRHHRVRSRQSHQGRNHHQTASGVVCGHVCAPLLD